MELTLLVLLVVMVVMVGAYLVWRLKTIEEKQAPSKELLEVVRLLQQGSKEDRKNLLESLSRNTIEVNRRLDTASKVMGDLQKNLGEMSEIGRGMKDLQEFLRNPKLRGNIGEQVLKELLSQMLPKQSFHLQYSFKTGDRVDAAIKTSAGIIPVDSKFPMEGFRKLVNSQSPEEKKRTLKQFSDDVKKHIDDISKKYILTEEGTIDYALMYVPSETVYYEIVNNTSLFEYSGKKRVLPVSPTTFYAYLKAILMSFEGQKIESRAKEILKLLSAIKKDYEKVDESLGVLQKHLNNANSMLVNVYSGLTKLGNKLSSTKLISGK